MLYVICGIRRTGTTVLVEMLHGAGLGFAHEFLNGVYKLPETPAHFVVHVFAMQPNNDYTGVKLTWGDIDRLAQHWQIAPHTAVTTIVNAFGESDVRYIYPTRRDHEAQARSAIRAHLTGQWHMRPGDVHADEPTIDERHMRDEMNWIAEAEARWEDYFSANNITPLRLQYETWQHDPAQAWAQIARFIGADVTYEDAPPVPLRKIARDHDRTM